MWGDTLEGVHDTRVKAVESDSDSDSDEQKGQSIREFL